MKSIRRTHRFEASTRAVACAATALVASTLLAGCASPGALPRGTSIDQARSGFLKPGNEYALPSGGTRLEFRQGAFGSRETYMLDFDTSGKLVDSNQVLTEAYLGTIKAGETEASVHLRVGRPDHIDGIGWQNLHVLDYRFSGADCVWYRISISNETGRVTEASLGPDPACESGRGGRL